MRSQVCIMRHHAAIFMALIVLLFVSACDNVPTFQELTGDAVEGEVPEQFAVDQAAAAPPRHSTEAGRDGPHAPAGHRRLSGH